MSDQIVINTKNGTKHTMDKDTYIRWLCLSEIIQLTEEKAEYLKIDLDKYDWIRPIDFKKYIIERFKSMEVDLEAEMSSRKIKINNTHRIPEYH